MLNDHTDKLEKKAFVPPDPAEGGAQGAPQGGMPPMDPAMMGMPPGGEGGGAPPMDPAAMGMPPGGMPMDPSMMGMPPPPEEGAGDPPPGGDMPEDPVIVSAKDLDEAVQKAVESADKGQSQGKSDEGEDRVAQLEKKIESLEAQLAEKPVEASETEEAPPDETAPEKSSDDLVSEMFTEEATASAMPGQNVEKTASEDWTMEGAYSRIQDAWMNVGDAEKRLEDLAKIAEEF